MKYTKAEEQICAKSLCQDEAVDVIRRLYKNAKTPKDVSPEEAELDQLFKWSKSPEGHEFWEHYSCE